MKIFKHSHKFEVPSFSEIWEVVHSEIFVEGNKEANIPVTCKCGKTQYRRVNVKLNMEK